MPNDTPQGFRSVLAAVDLSGSSARVIERAARLPWDGSGRLTILHVVLSRQARTGAEAGARSALETLARRAAGELPAKVKIRTRIERGTGAAMIVDTAESTGAELIVVGRGGAGRIREVFIGSTAERVVRQSRLPILLVRLSARRPYQRPVLAVDRDGAAEAATSAALRVLSPPRPPITLVHAYVTPFLGRMQSNLSRDEMTRYLGRWRQEATLDARKLLARARALSKSAGDDSVMWTLKVGHGTPRRVIRKAADRSRADLLAMGTRGWTGVAYAFLGTVAGDVLRNVSCDVLVAPPTGRRASG